MEKSDTTTNPKFEKVKEMFEKGLIPDLQTIFVIAPPTNIASSIGLHHGRLKAKIADPSLFKVKELLDIAALLKLDEVSFFNLVLASIKKQEAVQA